MNKFFSLNSPLWKIIGFIISIAVAFWSGGKVNQTFYDSTIFQSPTLVDSPNPTFNYDNSQTFNSSSIVTVDPTKNLENEIFRSIAERYDCSYEKIADSENDYQWTCQVGSLWTVENSYGSSKKNIRINLPDGKKAFIPFIPANDITIIGTCLKGEEYPDCHIHPFYSTYNYQDNDICYDIFTEWGDGPTPKIKEIIPIDCQKG